MITEISKRELKQLNKEIIAMRSKDALAEKLTKGFKDLLHSVDFMAQISKK